MKKIALIVPYFGKLPYNMQLWLESCRYNPTIDWLIYTDDTTTYRYPKNVKVSYCEFQDMQKRIQENYTFPIVCDRPYKLCDYRVCYGQIFQKELSGYDYWGYCDMDVLWGDIRKFITDEILEKYEKIGFQGHLTIYANKGEVTERYKTIVKNMPTYIDIFTSKDNCMFDENIIDQIYRKLNIPVYEEVHFAHLAKYLPDFFLCHLPETETYKNKHQIFTWKEGKLDRVYVADEELHREEFLYIHFFCRKMRIKAVDYAHMGQLVIYPNTIEQREENIDLSFVKKKAHTARLLFYLKYFYRNRKKFTLKKLRKAIYLRKEQMRRQF